MSSRLLGSKVLSGYQKTATANYFSMINSILGLAAILAAVLAHLSIVGLTISYSCAMLTGTLCLNGWLYFVGRPLIRPSLSAVRYKMARDLFGQGSLFFVLQVAGLIVFNSDNLVIAHYCGAGEVTPYSVSWRLMGYASMLYTLFVPSLWPAFADAYHRKDITWVRSTYYRVMRISTLGASSIAVLLAVFGRPLIRVWATQAAVPSSGMLWAMALWAVVFAATTNQACLLAATQRIGLQALTSALAAIFNLFASIYLVQRMGSIGVILATLMSYFIFIVAPQSWEVGNILRGRYLRIEHAG
jgi:O-antigen/teichoic acid export membrane protein